MANVVIFLRSFLSDDCEMDQEQCACCNGRRKSIYGHMCSDCKKLINGFVKDSVQTKCQEAEKKPKLRKKKKMILSTLDILISLFVVTPLVVACWRGTWQLMDIYADYFPPWESFLIGTTIHIVIAMSQDSFHEILNRKYSTWILNIWAFFLMKLYTILFNAVTNMSWRGSWIIIDEYFGIILTETGKTEVGEVKGAVAFFTVCFLIMFFMKSLRNLNSPPFELCLDYGDDMFLFPNMFRVKVSDKILLYILDVIYSVGIVNSLVIIVWRGIWLLVDVFLFPDDQVLSAWASVFLGYVMVAIVFLLQPIMKKICDNLSGIPKLLVADAYIMFTVICVIIVWRGIWNLLNIYFLPDYPELSCWLTHWIPLLILIFMGCSNSVLVRGVCADCEEPDGSCVVFPCNYLKVIVDQEKNDSWFSIWSGIKKSKQLPAANKMNLNYHIVQITGITDKDCKNNNKIEDGVS